MTNQEIDSNVLSLITNGTATTQGQLASSLGLDNRQIDNSFKRLKSKNLVRFNKEAGEWMAEAPMSKRPTVMPSGESAPLPETEVQSGDTKTAPPSQTQEGSPNMTTESNVAAIDSELAAAKAKSKSGTTASTGTKRPRLTAEEKVQRESARQAEREQRKAEREATRAAKKAERESNRKPAHMSKVDKAFAKLPQLSDNAKSLFGDATANLSRDDVFALAAHLNHFNRTLATERALGQKLNIGDTVLIVSGDSRFVGKSGTVEKSQRIRCYVKFDGVKKAQYFYTSDCKVTKAASVAKAS